MNNERRIVVIDDNQAVYDVPRSATLDMQLKLAKIEHKKRKQLNYFPENNALSGYLSNYEVNPDRFVPLECSTIVFVSCSSLVFHHS